MNYKIVYHLLPWEIDYALLTYTQFKKSKYHLTEDDTIEISACLNLSSYLIDWDNSKLPKQFFIDKFNQLSNLLVDYKYTPKIYDGDELYGHLDFQRESVSKEVDYYISLCPDMYFSEYLLTYLITSSKKVPNKYFVITPEINKLWDGTWDEISNENVEATYDTWNQVDIYDVRYNSKVSEQDIELNETQKSKWAGWFDLYSKSFFEELCPIQDDWKGYGPHDWYSLMITEHVKEQGVDFQQWVLRGESIFEYSVGPLLDGGFSKYYKDLLTLKEIPNQREIFESNMKEYLNRGVAKLKEKNII
jgi:hypothetical protein